MRSSVSKLTFLSSSREKVAKFLCMHFGLLHHIFGVISILPKKQNPGVRTCD